MSPGHLHATQIFSEPAVQPTQTSTVLPKNYTMATGRKLIAAQGLDPPKKNYTTALPSRPGRKKIIPQLWLPARCLSCCGIIYFSPENYTGIKFGQEPDALTGTMQNEHWAYHVALAQLKHQITC